MGAKTLSTLQKSTLGCRVMSLAIWASLKPQDLKNRTTERGFLVERSPTRAAAGMIENSFAVSRIAASLGLRTRSAAVTAEVEKEERDWDAVGEENKTRVLPRKKRGRDGLALMAANRRVEELRLAESRREPACLRILAREIIVFFLSTGEKGDIAACFGPLKHILYHIYFKLFYINLINYKKWLYYNNIK